MHFIKKERVLFSIITLHFREELKVESEKIKTEKFKETRAVSFL